MGAKTGLKSIGQWTVLLVALTYFLAPYTLPYGLSLFDNSISVTQILMVMGAVLLAVALWYERPTVPPRTRVIFALITLTLAALAFSTIVFQGLAVELLISVGAIAITVFLFALLERRFVDRLLVIAAAVSITASMLGILQFYFFGDILSPATYLASPQTVFYASGFANFPSLFGASLALFIPIFFGLSLLNYRHRRRLWAIAFFTGIIALILTFSRSALLGSGVGAVIMAAYAVRTGVSKKSLLLHATTAAVLVGAVLVTSPPATYLSSPAQEYYQRPLEMLLNRFSFLDFTSGMVRNSEVAPDDSEVAPDVSVRAGYEGISWLPVSITDYSVLDRTVFHAMSFDMLTHSPPHFLLGWGIEGFRANFRAFAPAGFYEDRTRGAHSLFLETAVSGGVLALALMLVFFAFLYREAWRLRRAEVLIVPLLAGLTGILIDGLFHTHLYTKYLWIAVGVILALAWQRARPLSRYAGGERKRGRE